MRIMGIDPGSQCTGFGIVEEQKGKLVSVHWGAVRAKAKQGFPERLKSIYQVLVETIQEFTPEEVAIEDLFFASNAKFDSGTGWPSFTESLPGAFKTKIDYSFGMKRVEYHCANCGVHHGHIFEDGSTSTQKRFCSNGLCLIFKPDN